MKASYRCTSIKEFNSIVKHIRSQLFTDIECVFNIGSTQYYEHPLFIFTESNVFRLYFSESELVLEVFHRSFFLEHCDKDIFRDPEHPGEFDYIYPEAYSPSSSICDVRSVKGCGTEQNLKGLDLIFSDGKHLCIRESEQVPYTMDSWIIESPS